MNRVVSPGALWGTVAAIPSKSDVHRLLICALLSDSPTTIPLAASSRDIEATARCIRALGARVEELPGALRVIPSALPQVTELPCGESGSTARFLLPLAAALGLTARFTGEGRLPERPLQPLSGVLREHGAGLTGDYLPCTVSKGLQPGDFALSGSVSSQFFTGLLFALPLLAGDSTLRPTTPMQSAAYLRMTESALRRFSVRFDREGEGWRIPGGQQYRSPGTVRPEGDWSGAAFWLAAGALCGPITVTGLDPDSPQGDKAMADLCCRFGAQVTWNGDAVTVAPGPLHGITIDARQIPDLVPVLAVLAGGAAGETVITGAERLRIKESDRLATTRALLEGLGVRCEERTDGLVIHGGRYTAGTVDGAGDHRIVMAAAVAALVADGPVTIIGAEAVEKSYPGFFVDLQQLGGMIHE